MAETTDKKDVSILLEGQLPEFVTYEHPKFKKFIEKYYEFMESHELYFEEITFNEFKILPEDIIVSVEGVEFITYEDEDRIQLESERDTASNANLQFHIGETITGNTSSATATTHASTATAIGDFDNKYISIAEAIIGVRRVIPFYDNSRSNYMFSSKYQFALQEMHQLGGQLVSYEMAQERLMLLNEMFTGTPMFRFNRHMDRLFLDISWGSDVSIDDWIVVECDKIIDPATFTDIWSDIFLKKYNTALMKKQWGQNLIKFEGMQLPGGVTMNGRQMYDDATAELDTISEQMSLRYELPVDHLIG